MIHLPTLPDSADTDSVNADRLAASRAPEIDTNHDMNGNRRAELAESMLDAIAADFPADGLSPEEYQQLLLTEALTCMRWLMARERIQAPQVIADSKTRFREESGIRRDS